MNAILQQICRLPTAPFVEEQVSHWIRQFCRQQGISLRADRHGNLLALRGRSASRWVFVAHMDHPGLVASRPLQRGKLRATFRGHVLASFLRGAQVVWHTPAGEIPAVVKQVQAELKTKIARRLLLSTAAPIPPGSCGMFALPVARQQGKLLHSRALDDLAGVAAILQALCRSPRGIAALFTRGEEEGFIGAIAAAREAHLIRKSDRLVSVECSAAQPYAPQGRGVIIRVGDRSSIFDPDLTDQLVQVAQQLATRNKCFQFQRALMSGGTCEATAFRLYGYRAAAVCIPLGNYHNMNRATGKLAAENIHLDDWENLVQLLTRLAVSTPASGAAALRQRLAKRYAQFAPLLDKPTSKINAKK